MGKLLSFNREGYISGNALCLKCGNEWAAEAPVGTVLLECPNCGCQGSFKSLVWVPSDTWFCDCGCDLFRINREFFYCAGCGAPQKF